MYGVKIAWGCGPIPLKSSKEYYAIMQVRREWEAEEPFFSLSGSYFWRLLMCRLHFRAVSLGVIPRDVLNIKEDISCRDYQLEMFLFH